MFKIILAFILTFILFFLGISAVARLSGMEKLALIKLTLYSIVCAALSFAVLFGLVITF